MAYLLFLLANSALYIRPAELIPALVEKWREGNQVVYAQRTSRQDGIWPRGIARRGSGSRHRDSRVHVGRRCA